MRLSELEFVDLYLGDDFELFKGLKGSPNRSDPPPPALKEQLNELRRACRLQCNLEKEPEFSLAIDNVMYRVTMMREVSSRLVFILRRSTAEVRPLEKIGIAPVFIQDLLAPDLDGLFVIAGQTGVGKTSTAVSIVDARLTRHGGMAVAIEDPPEVALSGERGRGRCMQVRASRRTGGFKEHLVRTLRANPDLIFMGEVREEAAAAEVVNASLNGHMIITTVHASSIVTAIERLATLASPGEPKNALQMLSKGLKMIIWQDLEMDPGSSTPRYVYQALSLVDEARSAGARNMIRSGNLSQLQDEIERQMLRAKQNPMGAR